MRHTAPLSAVVLFLALALAPGIAAQAAEPLLALSSVGPESGQQTGQQTETAPGLQPQAEVPLYQDQALAREHQRFTQFAIDQMHKMNANILGGKHSMQVQKHGHGLYRASYKAIDVEGIVCQVRRSPGNPNYFVGSVLYKEHILESVAQAPEASLNGQFLRVSEKQSRIIYSSKPGGGWQ
jgi:hypothetical protein